MRKFELVILSLIVGSALILSSKVLATRALNTASIVGPRPVVRGLLDSTVIAHAAGRGNPWVTLRDGYAAPIEQAGSSILLDQMKDNQALPVSLASADFDEDGVPDLVAGFASSSRGALSLLRGDADSVFPNTREAIEHRSESLKSLGARHGNEIQSPFLVQSQVFDMPGAPRILGAGDFDNDGHQDLVAAEPGVDALVLLAGDGHGSFAEGRTIPLPGRVTAMATGDVNRMDGLEDVVVAVNGVGGPRLLVFEGSTGAFNSSPEVIRLPSESRSIAIGQLDDGFQIDIAVGAGRNLLIIH